MSGAPTARWRRELASIRTRLLLVNAFLVIVPIAGISFARTYERELLRSEEEGIISLAAMLTVAVTPGAPADLAPPTLRASARVMAERLRVEVRVLDRGGRVVFDTGPERVEVRTRGRRLLPDSVPGRAARQVAAVDPPPPGVGFAGRPEVAVALQGRPGRYARRMVDVRGFMLFVAYPVRPDPAGPVLGVVYVTRSTYPVLLSLYRVRNALIKVALGSLAVGTLVAVFLTLTISRPLRRLTEAAGRIAAGERGVALNLRGRDEVGQLARDFDAMARALDERLAFISELAANVSHEFKTPIASVRGAAELLRDGAADDPAARQRFLDNILADAERLSALVSRLLELSRVESRVEPRVPLDYRALVTAVVSRYPTATLRWSAAFEHLRAAPEQVEAVLGNLLDNAVRFSPEGAPVAVRVEGDAHGFHTTVSDRGAGISEANSARVWDRFFTTARATGGTGLGLAIVRAVVEGHGGEVGVRSRAGEGCAFWFTLPRRL
jgi:two-component system, OmpR family, sensor histidine kinase ChvG